MIDNNKPYYSSLFIPKTITLSQSKNKILFIDEIIKILKILHQIKSNDLKKVSLFGYQTTLYNFYKLISSKFQNISQLLKIGLDIGEFFDNSKYPRILCHNDLVDGNWIQDTRKNIYLIDWDFASLNLRVFDICSFLYENNLSKKEKEHFIKSASLTKFEKNNLKKMLIYQDILWGFWALHYYYHETNKKPYLAIVQKKIKKL